MAAIEEAEKVSNLLMTIWDAADAGQQPLYPEHRMDHLLHLISNVFTDFATHKLKYLTGGHNADGNAQESRGAVCTSIWGPQSPADVVRSEAAVSDASTLLQTWRDRHIKQLMLDWMPGPRSISSHVWRGPAYNDKHMDAHISRFVQVREMLGLKRELLKVLGREEQQLVQDAFAGLTTVDAFKVSISCVSVAFSKRPFTCQC